MWFPFLRTCSAVECYKRSFRVHLRTFWLHEFTLRRRILEVGWSTDQIQIPGDENPAHILQGFLQRPGDVDIGRFLGLVQPQRFVGTMLDHGIEDRKRLGFMYNRLLRWATLVPLGIQGTTFCLPSSDEVLHAAAFPDRRGQPPIEAFLEKIRL
ncbi:hypothetical protein Focb16_v007820 [Fusarium oxysporum f. sp. cubense]|uniref:Uncharacterized protein n=1 Tax=Fusarium oxysporum f. sp. cubense TaxID=61366 RepID=A0A559LPL6_FUSOC|nr:hypothetical protein Focb16_v007820 [Fusarium oxysporum f. sp. cubense]